MYNQGIGIPGPFGVVGFTGPTGCVGATGCVDATGMSIIQQTIFVFKICENKYYNSSIFECYDVKEKTSYQVSIVGAIVQCYNRPTFKSEQPVNKFWKRMLEAYNVWEESWFEFYKFCKADVESMDVFRVHMLCYYVPLRLIYNECSV